MTREQFEKSEKIMDELRETEKFLEIFKQHYRLSVGAYERASTSLDSDKPRWLSLKDKGMSNSIEKIIEERIKELSSMLSEV